MAKKKILHIQVFPKLSGVQRISLEIFRALDGDEYDKWILFADQLENGGDKEQCIQRFEEAGARVILSPNLKREINPGDLAALREIYRLCKKEKFDIVHTHSTKPGIVGRIAASCAGVPLVCHTVHGLSFHAFTRFPRWQFYWFCEMVASFFCHRIVSVNRYYLRYFRLFRKKIRTIYNGLDFTTFSGYVTERKPDGKEVKVLFVGRLDNQKDPMTLLQAAKLVCEANATVTFTLVGNGEKYEECQEFISSCGLQDRIKLAGWQNDPAEFYKTHDIFVASSIYEAFGLMFVEAGYYGLPTVASRVEGIPEVILDGKTGFLVPPRNPEAMAEKILKLAADPPLRQKMGTQARERVLSCFDSGLMVKQYRELYGEADPSPRGH